MSTLIEALAALPAAGLLIGAFAPGETGVLIGGVVAHCGSPSDCAKDHPPSTETSTIPAGIAATSSSAAAHARPGSGG